MKKLIIIIPAHNEEKRISASLNSYLDYFSDLKKKKLLDFEIVLVLNNCRDKTHEIVSKIKKKELTILEFERGGKGFAVIEGFKEALKNKNDFIGFVDADASTSPKEFYRLSQNINSYDGIIASRYVKGAIVDPKPSMMRIIVSRMFNLLIRGLFMMNYSDTQCGAKIFKRETINKIINNLRITQWAFDVDLLYQIKKNKLKILEFPTVWSDKEYSKLNFMKVGPKMVLSIIRLRLVNSKLNFIIRAYDKLPKFLKIRI